MTDRLSRRLAFAAVLVLLSSIAWTITQFGNEAPLEGSQPQGNRALINRPQHHSVPSAEMPPPKKLTRTENDYAEPRAAQDASAFEQPIFDNMTATDLQVLKENYSCDLALTARQECDLAYEDAEAYEMCLSLRQYYSYSRHCGYQP